jgi:hypothetical protein
MQRRVGAPLTEDCRARQGCCLGRHQRAGQMNERADRAIIIGEAGRLVACRSRGCAAGCLDTCGRMSARAIEVHVSEREHELERKRKERNART